MYGVVAVLVFLSVVAVQGRPGLFIGGGSIGGGSGYGGGSFSGGGGHGGGSAPQGPTSLTGTPDINSYSGLHYPSYDIQELGTIYEGTVPSQTVKVTNTLALKIPKPYPVKVPHHVPYPVPVAKPYPVPVTQLIKVPHAVPVEVVKKIPVPIEVPKPYPVPHNELHDGGSSGGLDSYDGGLGGHQHLSELPSTSYGEPIQGGSGGGYDSYASHSENSFGGHEGQADQSAGYPAVAPAADEGQPESEQDSH